MLECDRPDCLFPDCLCVEPTKLPKRKSGAMKTLIRLGIVAIGAMLAFLLVSFFLFVTGAHAHSAGPSFAQQAQAGQTAPSYTPGTGAAPVGEQPKGWSYPWACCSGMDCQRISQKSVHEGADGYTIDGSTDTAPISYGDKRIKESPDGDFHWCAHRTGIDVGKTICLFAPPRGY